MMNPVHLSRVDLNLLVLFDAVMAERHVTRAAGRLHLTPSAVSHGLSRLRRLLHDPLFLRHPKGVAPTGRALELAPAIAELLARADAVFTGSARFVPATASRRFVVAAPEAIAAVVLPSLLARLRRIAPRVEVGVRNLVGRFGASLDLLDRREIDVAAVPLFDVPPRFEARVLFPEEFVLVARRGHPLGASPSLARYCAAGHVLVSESGDTRGMVDELLAARGLQRHVALAVPSFILAMAIVERSDLVAALPGRFVSMYRSRFRVRVAKPPIPMPSDPISAIASRAALAEAGLAWFVGELQAAVRPRR